MLNQQTGFLLKSFVWNIKSGPQKKKVFSMIYNVVMRMNRIWNPIPAHARLWDTPFQGHCCFTPRGRTSNWLSPWNVLGIPKGQRYAPFSIKFRMMTPNKNHHHLLVLHQNPTYTVKSATCPYYSQRIPHVWYLEPLIRFHRGLISPVAWSMRALVMQR